MTDVPAEAAFDIVRRIRSGEITLSQAHAELDVLAGHPVKDHYPEPDALEVLAEAVDIGLLTPAEALRSARALGTGTPA